MYQSQLPFAKERVIAALLIFAFSIAMVTMTAFAWTTLSVSPEVSGATTTITANGNLEIALAGSYETIYETKEVQKKDENDQPMFDDNGNPIMETVFVLDSNGKQIVKEIKAVPPSASAVGDALLSIQDRNQTWGNLINLSDPSYGLDQIILRPATLNTSGSLAKKPFVSAKYGPDGRVDHTNNSEFAYTRYQEIANGVYGFLKSDVPGVKAVSSVLAQPTHIESKLGLYYTDMLTDTIPITVFGVARTNLQNIVASMDLAYANSSPLSGLMSVYLNGLLYKNLTETAPEGWELPDSWNSAGKTTYTPAVCDKKDMEQILAVMKNLDSAVLNILGEGYVELFYLYQMDTYIDREAYDKMENPEANFKWPDNWKKYAEDKNGMITDEGLDDFLATAPGLINTMVSKRTEDSDKTTLNDFKTKINNFKTLRTKLKNAIANLENEFAEGDEIHWYEVQNDVNALVNIQTTKINGKTLNEWFGSLSANIDTLPGMLKNSADKNNAVVQAGIIRDIDAMLFSNEGGIHIQKISVKAEIGAIKHRAGDKSWALSLAGINSDQTIYANIKTNAPTKDANNQWNPSVTSEALIGATNTLDTGYVVYSYKALDTYGLSLDFWLRTNVPGASLILEGEVEFEEQEVTKTLADGTVVTRYLASIKQTTEESGKDPEVVELKDVLVYFLNDESGTAVWYYDDSNTLVETEEIVYDEEGKTVIFKTTSELIGEPVKKTEKIAVGYSSSNRIWKDSDFPVGIDPQYSTTQGSGSCYTFYADPTELNTILGVLERMRVVFIDGDGKQLAQAKLDTKYCFSEYGRHLVPLVIYSDGETTVTDPVTGQEITYKTITNMQTNTPTLISALIYLEGTSLENKDVLASSDIQGQFNIQFGTVYDEIALKDETLMKESITLAAEITGESENSANGTYTKTVTATITGLKSSTDAQGNTVWPTVTANFTRKISSTQGSVYFPAPLAFTTMDGTTWTCDFTFTTPGDYIMRSLTIDGQERMLDVSHWVEFTIEGFKINNLNSPLGQKYTYMTAGSYVSDSFTLDITASDAFKNKMPTSVKGVFTNEDNVNVDLNFKKTSSNGGVDSWSANINFNASGTYTLRYLLLDGEYYELTNPFVREVILGLKTKVWLTAPKDFSVEEAYFYDTANDIHSFFYINPNAKHEFSVVLEIYDETGKEIRQLGGNTGVELVYGTMMAKLKWNASADNYSGAALTLNSPGVYSFTKVDIPITTVNGTNTQTVTSTVGAPTVRIMSKDPYKYIDTNVGKDTITSQPIKEFNTVLAPNPSQSDSPRVEVNFDNAASASDSVYGKFKLTKANGDVEYLVLKAEHTPGTDTDDTFVFYIPTELDGFYQLMEVKFTNVMGEGQHFYQSELDLRTTGEDGKYAFDDADPDKFASISYTEDEQESLKVKIIVTMKTIIEGGNGYTTNFTGAFLEKHTLFGDGILEVSFVDFENLPIKSLGDFNFTIAHNRETMNQYYTISGNGYDSIASRLIQATLSDPDGDGVYTAVLPTKEIYLAGQYTVSMETVAASPYDPNRSLYVDTTISMITVTSVLPTVEITSISPTGSVAACSSVTNSGSSCSPSYKHTHETVSVSLTSSTNATVYFACDGGSSKVDYTQPTVAITLAGLGSATKATLSFAESTGGKVHLYTSEGSSSATTDYSWTADGSCNRYVGSFSNSSLSNDSKTAAGTLTANTLVLTDGTCTYTIQLPVGITIKNPK